MIQELSYLFKFLEVAEEDPRISPAHISLYAAILYYHVLQEYRNPISIYGRDLRKLAKVYAAATYHKCMGELKDYGYIRYIPSYNPGLGSLVYLKDIK